MNVNDPREDALVEEIARRVIERLGSAHGALPIQAAAPARSSRFHFPGQGECGVCAVPGTCSQTCPDLFRAFLDCGASRLSTRPGLVRQPGDLAQFIDHTLLKADATAEMVLGLCREARENRFASVCVNGGWVRLAREQLEGSGVLVCSVVGFPLGAMHPEAKAQETRRAVQDGAQEIDMVIFVGALKGRDYKTVERDIRGVVEAVRCRAAVKVIIEAALLTRDEKIQACALAKAAGADFVKTSTGFAESGATVEDIRLMRETVGPEMGIKAAGGIRDTDTAMAMVAAGATRIGASASVKIVKGTAGAAPAAAVAGKY